MAFAAPETDTEPQGFSAPPEELDPTTPNVSGFTAPKEDVDNHISTLAKDETFDPVSHYTQNPEDLATAREVFKRRADEPMDWGKAAGQFVKGAVPAVGSGIASLTKGAMGFGSNFLSGRLGLYGTPEEQQRARLENMAALQLGAEKGFHDLPTGLARNVSRLFGKTDRTLSDLEIDERIRNDAAQRQVESELSKGELAGGQGDYAQPEALVAQGTPVRPETVESASFMGDPTSYVIPGLAEAAGPVIGRAVTAPVLKTAGKAIAGAGKAADAVLTGHKGLFGGLAYGLFTHNPLAAAGGFAADVAAKQVAPYLGRTLQEAGAEAAGALPPGIQNVGTKALKAGAQGALTGAAISAPFAAAAQSPEEAGSALGGGLGIGGALGAAGGIVHGRAIDVAGKFNQLAQEGAAIKYGYGLDDAHAVGMAQLTPQDQMAVNAYRARFNGMTSPDGRPIQIYALSAPNYLEQVNKAGGGNASGTRGFISGDGTQVFVNAGAPEPQIGLAHEAGGHATEFLGQIAKEHDVATMQDTLRKALYNPDGTPTPMLEQFTQSYRDALTKGGASPELLRAIGKLDPTYFEKEFIAQHAVKILNGENIANFHLPKPLTERLTQGASQWMRDQGILPKTGGDIGWGGNEIKAVTDQLRDVLYNQGKKSEDLRVQRQAGNIPEPTVSARIAQLEAQTAKPPTGATPLSERNAYRSAMRELAGLREDIGNNATPAQGIRPTPPSQPNVPTEPSRHSVAAALRQQGIPAPEAAQWASVAKGNTVDEMVVDAIKQRGAKKFPSQTPNVPAPVAAQGASVPEGANPAATGTVVSPEATPQAAIPTPAEVPSGNQVNEPPVKTTRTPEEVARIATDAEATATAAEKKPSTQAAQTRIRAAKLNALLDAIGDDPTGLHRVTDQFGNTSIVGEFDPSDPLHTELVKVGGNSKLVQQRAQDIQAKKGTPQYILYRSAEKPGIAGSGGEGSVPDFGMEQRRKEYEAQPAQERAAGQHEGTTQQKVVIPLGTSLSTKSGKLQVSVFTMNELLSNAESVFSFMREKGLTNPYGRTYDEQEPQLVSDAQAYAENHAHGFTGDGTGPIKQFPDSGLPKPDPAYTPKPIPKDRFDVLNMLFANEKAGKLGEVTASIQAKQEAGKQPTPRDLKQRADAEEAYNLAQENARWVDHQSGETNALRAQLKGLGFDTADALKNPIETLEPQNILKQSDAPIEGTYHNARPHGFSVDPAQLAKEGLPRSKAVAGNFSPIESTGATDALKERAAKLWASKRTASPFFKKWQGKAKLYTPDDDLQSAKDGKPIVAEMFHGTTRNFTIADPSKANVENDFGKGFYLTNTPDDVGENYAGVGPDLTARIERRTEYYENSEELPREEAEQKAREELTGHGGATMKVFAKLDNPLKLGQNELYWGVEFPEEEGEPTGKMVDFVNAIRDEASRFDEADPQSDRLDEMLYEGGKPSDAIAAAKETYPYATDENGDIATSEIIRAAIEHMGYDGIIDGTVDTKFGSQRRTGKQMSGMHEGTVHVIAFKSDQIKSATGNAGTFDPKNPDMRFSPGREYDPRSESTPIHSSDRPAYQDRYEQLIEKNELTPAESAEYRTLDARMKSEHGGYDKLIESQAKNDPETQKLRDYMRSLRFAPGTNYTYGNKAAQRLKAGKPVPLILQRRERDAELAGR